ncbi:MAG: hypothetical protein KJ914_16095 [Gammaproteobacteria bacterium]|nr:hypothetical protein [Gammaproteobacteria bacterium]MBU1725250.1 hypothetical protein [Gammaproteobacteria bacterium]MBU2005820.1 hypothetical protein [Gammaproteobacteria bacterium]
MNDLVARAYCVVPAELLKSLLISGIVGIVFVGIARVIGMDIPAELMIGLIGFFFAGAILVSHGLSILYRPGLVLLVGITSIVAAVHLQDAILSLI